MKGFDSRFIDELKSKSDLVETAGRYVALQKKGGNFWGRCPFHHEKTASFCVNEREQFYYCFGCHKSGDVISLVMELESVDFADAVKILAERAKMPLPEINADDEKLRAAKQKKERLYALLTDTARFYAAVLRGKGADRFIGYAQSRGFDGALLNKFGIGASPDFNSLIDYLRDKKYSYTEMAEAGVAGNKNGRYYDALGGRLIIPIINPFGQVIAFGGRLIEKADFAKYKNTEETPVFSKSSVLYNLNNVKKLKNEKGIDGIIVVEGYMDVIALDAAGIHNVVASMGTSLTKEQARILKRYTEKVYISYDGDSAGQKATVRGLEILKDEGLDVKVVALPEGLDPDEVVKKYGKEEYENRLKNALPLIDFKMSSVKKGFDLKSVDGKRKYVAKAVDVVRESDSPVEQEELLKKIRDESGVSLDALKRELYKETADKPVTVNTTERLFSDAEGDKTDMAERFVLSAFLSDKPYAGECDAKSLSFSSPVREEIKKYIVDSIENGEKPKLNYLYENFDEYPKEISAIAAISAESNKKFDEERYFADCVKAMKTRELKNRLFILRKTFSEETDNDARRRITAEISGVLNEMKKLGI